MNYYSITCKSLYNKLRILLLCLGALLCSCSGLNDALKVWALPASLEDGAAIIMAPDKSMEDYFVFYRLNGKWYYTGCLNDSISTSVKLPTYIDNKPDSSYYVPRYKDNYGEMWSGADVAYKRVDVEKLMYRNNVVSNALPC